MTDFALSEDDIDIKAKQIKRKSDSIAATKEFEQPEVLFNDLIERIKKYHPSADTTLIKKAYDIAVNR